MLGLFGPIPNWVMIGAIVLVVAVIGLVLTAAMAGRKGRG
jgi:multisubunit Na+/H+ antiporter MnhC subunit